MSCTGNWDHWFQQAIREGFSVLIKNTRIQAAITEVLCILSLASITSKNRLGKNTISDIKHYREKSLAFNNKMGWEGHELQSAM